MKTCANCEFMKIQTITRGSRHAYCSNTGKMEGMIVPHAYDGFDAPDDFKFWRIPMNCSRTDVEKNETRIPESEWQTITVKVD